MKSVAKQLEEYLKESGIPVSSGELQRFQWKNRNGTLATPRSIVRRLEEMAEEGVLNVEIRNNHAWYSGEKIEKKIDYVRHPLTGERITTIEYATL